MRNLNLWILVCIATISNLKSEVHGDETETELSTTEPTAGTGDGVDNRCARYGGNYFRGVRCCNGRWLNIRSELFNFGIDFQKCLQEVSKSPDNKDDELPALLWKAYICILKSTSAFPDNTINFQAYVTHMTSNYESVVKAEVLAANSDCPNAEDETEDWRKVMTYAECFHKNEKSVCHHPTAEYEEKQKNYTIGLSSMNITFPDLATCTPLEGTFASYDDCCQKTPIPVGLQSVLKFGLLNQKLIYGEGANNRTAVNQCSLSFMNRQVKLKSEAKSGEKKTAAKVTFVRTCSQACLFSPINYEDNPEKLELNTTGMELDYYAKSMLPDTFPEKLSGIIEKSRTNSTLGYRKKLMTFDQLVDEFKEVKDELVKIELYCLYYQWTSLLIQLTFREYCTDAEWMSKTRWIMR